MKKLWEKIVAYLYGIPVGRLLNFIGGLILAAIFAIPLCAFIKVPCIVPVIFGGFIKEFIKLQVWNKFDWKNYLAICLGGLVIQILQIL